MTRHIVMWNFLDTMTEEEKKAAGAKMIEILEPLKDQISGVLSLKVVINEYETSHREVALIGEYESFEALKAYAVHPLHVEAGKYIKTVCCDRVAFDYEM